jgi:hypothetical protein
MIDYVVKCLFYKNKQSFLFNRNPGPFMAVMGALIIKPKPEIGNI